MRAIQWLHIYTDAILGHRVWNTLHINLHLFLCLILWFPNLLGASDPSPQSFSSPWSTELFYLGFQPPFHVKNSIRISSLCLFSRKRKKKIENIEISILLLVWWDVNIYFYILSFKLWVTLMEFDFSPKLKSCSIFALSIKHISLICWTQPCNFFSWIFSPNKMHHGWCTENVYLFINTSR